MHPPPPSHNEAAIIIRHNPEIPGKHSESIRTLNTLPAKLLLLQRFVGNIRRVYRSPHHERREVGGRLSRQLFRMDVVL